MPCAEEAWRYLLRCKEDEENCPVPDLILLDLNMPGMGGQEFLRLLKSDEMLSSIPVVILTTSDSDKDIVESFKLQASGYIKKPGSLAGFQEIMHNVTDYWFVICKRVNHGSGYDKRDNMCSIGR
jgi:CheY-like chemotaxis protein